MAPSRRTRRRLGRALRDFYWKAYQDNLTGLSAMVAYNLLLSIFPLALLALFIAGKILQSGELEDSVLKDLRHLFPTTAEKTLEVIRRVQEDGTCWCGGTVWHGKTAMRISVSSWATTDEDIERSADAVIRLARQ